VDVIHYQGEMSEEELERKMEQSKRREKEKQQKDNLKRQKELELEEARKKIQQLREDKRASSSAPFSYAPQPKHPSGGMGYVLMF
jgi:hypothetical protein